MQRQFDRMASGQDRQGPETSALMQQRQGSTWYPTMRIFRQPQLGAWGPVIAEVKSALSIEAEAHRRRD